MEYKKDKKWEERDRFNLIGLHGRLENLSKKLTAGDHEVFSPESRDECMTVARRLLGIAHECDTFYKREKYRLEDGRVRWMVDFRKFDYFRTKARRLEAENKALKDALREVLNK